MRSWRTNAIRDILWEQCGGGTEGVLVQTPSGLPDGAVVGVSGIFQVEPLVTSPWPLAALNQPCLLWPGWQFRGGEGCTVYRDQFHFLPPKENASRVCEAGAKWCDSLAAQREKLLDYRKKGTQKRQYRSESPAPRGVVAYLISWFLQARGEDTKEPSSELVTDTSEPGAAASTKLVKPEEQMVPVFGGKLTEVVSCGDTARWTTVACCPELGGVGGECSERHGLLQVSTPMFSNFEPFWPEVLHGTGSFVALSALAEWRQRFQPCCTGD